MINYVIKRDGSQAAFDPKRITQAIFKAAQSVGGDDSHKAEELTKQVVDEIFRQFNNIPAEVEEIQDIVERVLIKSGHDRTAKSYILYRAKHNEIRKRKKEEIINKISRHEAMITTKEGCLAKLSVAKIYDELNSYLADLNQVQLNRVINEALGNMYEGITTKEIQRALINAARNNIEMHSDYSFLAARMLLKPIYKSLLGLSPTENQKKFKSVYKSKFADYITSGVNFGLLDPKLKSDFDLDLISAAIIPQRDNRFEYRGAETVTNRYLLRTPDYDKEIFELPQYMWMRIAMGLSLSEKAKERTAIAIDFYNTVSEMYYMPSTQIGRAHV